jgi:hypothetical protein
MQLDPPAQEGEVRRRLGGLLVWSGLTLLAALALALAMVIASLALELGSERHRTQPRRSSSARRAASNWPSERPAGGRWPASSRL